MIYVTSHSGISSPDKLLYKYLLLTTHFCIVKNKQWKATLSLNI